MKGGQELESRPLFYIRVVSYAFRSEARSPEVALQESTLSTNPAHIPFRGAPPHWAIVAFVAVFNLATRDIGVAA